MPTKSTTTTEMRKAAHALITLCKQYDAINEQFAKAVNIREWNKLEDAREDKASEIEQSFRQMLSGLTVILCEADILEILRAPARNTRRIDKAMKILRTYCCTMGLPGEAPVFRGICDIDETATTWRISFRPYSWERPSAVEWVYKKKSHKEDGKTSAVLPKFWKDYKQMFTNQQPNETH